MNRYSEDTARRIVDGINNWEIQAMSPSIHRDQAWEVTIGSTPRVVGDLLPGYVEGSEDGVTFPLDPCEGTAEMSETVLLRSAPVMEACEDSPDLPGVDVPGIVMWGMLTSPYESKDLGTFRGTIAFYQTEAEGADIMDMASVAVSRRIVDRALDEVDAGIRQMEGNEGQVVDHAGRILDQMGRLGALLSGGIAATRTYK